MPTHEYGTQEVDLEKILIIHPGSLYVRIGRASDVSPCTVLHAIARKRKDNGTVRIDSMLPASIKFSFSQVDKFEKIGECKQKISLFLQSLTQSNGKKRQIISTEQVKEANRYVELKQISSSGGEWLHSKEDYIVGEEVLNLDPSLPYNVHFPLYRGDLNVNSSVSGSLMSVLADLQAIWSHIIHYHLDIDISTLSKYRVVLIIPDIFSKNYAKHLMSLLINEMKFSSGFLVQDHVAATFGAGISYACVVDIGHMKTSISCVEDAISNANTRVRLGYGGADVTQAFHWLLQKCAFPYYKCNPSVNKSDAFLIQKLKQDYCHVQSDVSGMAEKTFIVRQPKQPVVRYTIQMGDECIIPVVGLFYPDFLGITGNKTVLTQPRLVSEPEDYIDEEYLREQLSKRKNEQSESIGAETNTDLNSSVQVEDDLSADNSVTDANTQNSQNDSCLGFITENGQPVGLDEAIVASINKCSSEELKRKFFGSILIVGGGVKFPGFVEFLEMRISKLLPAEQNMQVEVFISSKEIETENVCWKGAAVLSILESARELWISPAEWKEISVRLLRERSLLTW